MIISNVRRVLTRQISQITPQPFRTFASFDCGPNDGKDDIVHLEDPLHITIPSYPQRPNEDLSVKRQRLMYQSRKRGMLENDLLLSTFAAKFLKTMTLEQVNMYDALINQPSNDWEIFYWATCKKPTPIEYDNEIMAMLREHVQNKDKQMLKMPELHS